MSRTLAVSLALCAAVVFGEAPSLAPAVVDPKTVVVDQVSTNLWRVSFTLKNKSSAPILRAKVRVTGLRADRSSCFEEDRSVLGAYADPLKPGRSRDLSVSIEGPPDDWGKTARVEVLGAQFVDGGT